MKPQVNILVSVNKPETFESCTLCFDSIRVGFPRSHFDVHCYVNEQSDSNLRLKAIAKAERCGNFDVVCGTTRQHHAGFIQSLVYSATNNRPMIFVDPDTIWWESCESWIEEFSGKLLAGYFVPRMWNDFAKCISAARIHTSNMWFPNPTALRMRVEEIYPYSWQPAGEYCPCDFFYPAVKFLSGQPMFWDTTANLFNALPEKEVAYFNDKHKAAFDHLNSASFFDVMCERMDDSSGMRMAHLEGVKPENRHLLKNLWQYVDAYYRRKSIEGLVAEMPSLHASHQTYRSRMPRN